MKRYTFNADWNRCSIDADEQGDWVEYKEAQSHITALQRSVQSGRTQQDKLLKRLEREQRKREQLEVRLREVGDAILSGVGSVNHGPEPVLYLRDNDALLRIVKLVTDRAFNYTDEES